MIKYTCIDLKFKTLFRNMMPKLPQKTIMYQMRFIFSKHKSKVLPCLQTDMLMEEHLMFIVTSAGDV